MTASENPSFEVDSEGVGWITFDDPERPLNVLTEPVMLRLAALLEQARDGAREARIRAVVIRSGKPTSFIAGADIDAIGGVEDPQIAERQIRLGQGIFQNLADLPVPTIAAVHGVCVGGGVEMSLACDRRILSDSSRTTMSLPEVQLGILPAWGGTTRLPRLVGLRDALDMLLTGKKVRASKARRIGLASALVPADLFDEEVTVFARRVAKDRRYGSTGKTSLLTKLTDGPGRKVVLTMARRGVMEKTDGNYPAPLRILDVLGDTLGGSVEDGLVAEAKAAAELIVSPVCKNLIHVFHMREAARKGEGLALPIAGEGRGPSVGAKAASARGGVTDIHSLGVLGAGVMGGGIAQLAATRGVRVYMKDIEHDAVTGGLQHARSLLDKATDRRKMTRREADQAMERVSGGVEYHGLAGADLVVEAIVERMDVKKAVLRETEAHVDDDAILATNTSSLSVSEMAEALTRPERFCGMHFFNPVHRMPLVEVIRGARTTDDTVARVYRLAVELGKIPVVVGDGPGFLVNRILGPYLNEAGYLLSEGRKVEDIDRVAVRFGMPMGPLRLIDEVGIDVSGHAGAALHEGLGDRLAPSPLLVALADTDRLGRKGGRGFYRYEKGKEKGVDPSIYEELAAVIDGEGDAPSSGVPASGMAGSGASSRGSKRGDAADRIVRRRLVLAMINEAARVLDDGIVRRAQDVDLAMIMGTGFPPFRGGLLRFADTLHPRGLVDRLEVLMETYGPRFEPAPNLVRLAEDDRLFYDAYPGTVGEA